MHYVMPYTGIPSPILAGIFAIFAVLYALAAWRDYLRNR